MKHLQAELQQVARRLLAEKAIVMLAGWAEGSRPLRTTPIFITSPADADRLVLNSCCANNLAVYLPALVADTKRGTPGKIGIVCKGCDGRAVVQLIKEHQLSRDDVHIIGVACSGLIDIARVLAELGPSDPERIEETPEGLLAVGQGASRLFRPPDCLYASCKRCAHPSPLVYDTLLGARSTPPPPADDDPAFGSLEALTRAERWLRFEAEMAKCIRCYACRKACPNCYCRECFAEETRPQWIGVSTDRSDVMFFHLGRILHQADRCTDCGACVRACPMGVDLRLFAARLPAEVKVRFKYEAGLSCDEPAPLATFAPADQQDFMTEP